MAVVFDHFFCGVSLNVLGQQFLFSEAPSYLSLTQRPPGDSGSASHATRAHLFPGNRALWRGRGCGAAPPSHRPVCRCGGGLDAQVPRSGVARPPPGRCLTTLCRRPDLGPSRATPVGHVCFAPNAKYLLVSYLDDTLKLWRWAGPACAATCPGGCVTPPLPKQINRSLTCKMSKRTEKGFLVTFRLLWLIGSFVWLIWVLFC